MNRKRLPARKKAADLAVTDSVASELARFLKVSFWRQRDSEHTWITELSSSEPWTRILLVREGVPAQAVQALADALHMSRDQLTRTLGLPRATVARKLSAGGRLGVGESEQILGIARLIGLVQRIVQESGSPEDFNAAQWTARWIETPVPALGGRTPIALMDTAEGRQIVLTLVSQMQSGAYA